MESLPNFTDPVPLSPGLVNSSAADFAGNSGYTVVHQIQTVCVPIFFLFGLLGNLLALGCFLSQTLREASCCLYMAAKCVSDTAFLAVVFVMWLYRLHVDLINVQGVCQLTIFVSYVSGFMSVWLVLAVTCENYIRICRPHLSKTYCTRRKALLFISVVLVVAAVFYSFALWTNTVLGGGRGGGGGGGGAAAGDGGEEEDYPPLCMAMVKFKDVLMVMTFVDTLMTLVLPSVLIVPLVLLTLLAVGRAVERKNRLRDSLLGKRSPRGHHGSVEVKVARFLLSVSLTFLLLHTPGHLIRLKLLVHRYLLHKEFSTLDAMLHRLFETLYYFNFCCSIVIFLASGANFRSLFLAMYCAKVVTCCSSLPSPSSSSTATTTTTTTTTTTATTADETAMTRMERRRRGAREQSVTTLVGTDSVRTTLSLSSQ